MKSIFEQLAPFIQEYIYQQGWEELRPIQVAACDTIFHTEEHVLLASQTASRKNRGCIFTDINETL